MTEITTTGSNGIISKSERIFAIFVIFSKSAQDFARFEKKDQLHSANILEVIDPDKCGYFNAR